MSKRPGSESSHDGTPQPWPEVILGGTGKAFVDVLTPDDNVKLPKEVVSYGTVVGVPWSLTGFWSDGGGSYSESPGACAELFLGADGEGGGTAICADALLKGFPSAAPVRMSFLYSGAYPGFVGYFGLAPAAAELIRVEMSTGDVLSFDILSTTQELGSRCFVFFAPPDSNEKVSIVDGEGAVLATRSLRKMPIAGVNETIGGECR